MARSKRKRGHIPLMNGRARAAQTYPNALCRAICRGIIRQIQANRQGEFMLAALNVKGADEAQEESEEILQQVKLAEEHDHPNLAEAYDDISGAMLDPQQVYKARMEEVKFIRDMRLYDKVSTDECWQVICKGPITTKREIAHKWMGYSPRLLRSKS